MEDFGYQKDSSKTEFPSIVRRVFLVGATLFSITCFVYVTINAYYFVYQDSNGEIETIKSPEGPIKVFEEEQTANSSNGGVQIDRSIYEDIFGNKKESLQQANPKVRNAPEPALPPKPIQAKESAPIVNISPATKPANNIQQEQKIVVYSNQEKKEPESKDLLTKIDGEKRAATPTKTASPDKKRAVRVQVAAMASKAAAKENWDKLTQLYPSLFSGLKSFTEEVNLGKRGIFYRLQIGDFYNQIEAEEFCGKYVAQARKSRADCIVVE
jgi:hypothetical protein